MKRRLAPIGLNKLRREWNRSQEHIDQQSKHEERAEFPIIEECVSDEKEGPASLPLRTGRWLGFKKFRIDLQERGDCQEYDQQEEAAYNDAFLIPVSLENEHTCQDQDQYDTGKITCGEQYGDHAG